MIFTGAPGNSLNSEQVQLWGFSIWWALRTPRDIQVSQEDYGGPYERISEITNWDAWPLGTKRP